jgi:protein TonB
MPIAVAIAVLLHLLVLGSSVIGYILPPPAPMEPPSQPEIKITVGDGAMEANPAPKPEKEQNQQPSQAAPDSAATEKAEKTEQPSPQSLPSKAAPAQQQAAPQINLPSGRGAGLPPVEVDNPLAMIDPNGDPNNAGPVYPLESALRREAGIVQLIVHVDAQGAVEGIDIAQSSGFPDLDHAAITAARRWHFRPAFKDGHPVASLAYREFEFVLERHPR